MPARTSFAPFKDLLSMTDVMNTLFDDRSTGGSIGYDQGVWIPFNVAESTQGYLLQAAVPGVAPDNLEITFQDNVLTVSGEFTPPQWDAGTEQPRYHRLEWRPGRFARSVAFPSQVEPDSIQTQLRNGVLSVFIPKAEASKPRKITIMRGATPTGEALGNEQPAQPSPGDAVA